MNMDLNYFTQQLQDIRVDCVSTETGISKSTIMAIRDGKKGELMKKTHDRLAEYFKRRNERIRRAENGK